MASEWRAKKLVANEAKARLDEFARSHVAELGDLDEITESYFKMKEIKKTQRFEQDHRAEREEKVKERAQLEKEALDDQ
jgi:hypothetical protein